MPDLAPRFSLRQLQYLVAVAETLHFRRAAERCQVSQPALSAQIAELEDALGVPLFERNQRRVILTAAGEQLAEHARRVLWEARALAEAAHRFTDPFSGTLRIGAIPTLGPYLLPTLAPAIRAAHPKLQVYWHEDKTASLVEAIGRGHLDAALVARESELGELVQVALSHDPFWAALAPSHPLAAQAGPLSLEALQGEPLLLLGEGHCLRGQVVSACASGAFADTGFQATSMATLVQMVAGGLGLTLLPGVATAQEGTRAGIVLRPLEAPAPGRTIALAWRRNSALTEALRSLAGLFRGLLEGRSAP